MTELVFSLEYFRKTLFMLPSTLLRPLKVRHPTTSFLTATTLIYAIGAGITAAAGTRLALQWILDKGFGTVLIPITNPL